MRISRKKNPKPRFFRTKKSLTIDFIVGCSVVVTRHNSSSWFGLRTTLTFFPQGHTCCIFHGVCGSSGCLLYSCCCVGCVLLPGWATSEDLSAEGGKKEDQGPRCTRERVGALLLFAFATNDNDDDNDAVPCASNNPLSSALIPTLQPWRLPMYHKEPPLKR